MTDPGLAATDLALIQLAKMVSQNIQISTHCVLALEEAKLLDGRRARMISRNLKKLADLLDDPDALDPGSHAQALHRIARMLQNSHPTTPSA